MSRRPEQRSRCAASAAAGALCAALLGLSACSFERVPPDVIVVLLDTVRSDHVEPYGAREGASPFLATMAARSVVFANAFSSSSFTAPSAASLFTGQYATRHGVTLGFVAKRKRSTERQVFTLRGLQPETELLTTVLNRQGYATFGISTNPQVGVELGFERGFDAFAAKRSANEVLEQLEEWKPALDAANATFVYLHLNDAHGPYRPRPRWLIPPEDERDEERAAYASEIGFVDDRLGKMIAMLDPEGDAVLVIVSDHGEEFGDHGGRGHGNTLYAELNRIVFMLRAPELAPARVATNVGIVDVLPTLLDLLAVDERPSTDGRSLLELIRAEAAGDVPRAWRSRALYAHREEQNRRGRVLEAVIQGNWKLITRTRRTGVVDRRLFDIGKDPTEQKNLARREPMRAGRLQQQLSKAPRVDFSKLGEKEVTLDERQLEELRALGYVEDDSDDPRD